ncbi:MAG: S1 RNA-binding domain-containing protein [Proteobacteria bacterium]|nr:S1 RNA-binding domain-containing protein [Pseudomonadota bacterium]
MYDVLYEACPWHARVALFDPSGRLIAVHYDDELRPALESAVILGRVRKMVPGLNAAFVDIGEIVDGFLPLNTLPKDKKSVSEGEEIMVRVTRSSILGKGAKLDARVIDRRPEGQVKVPSVVRPAPIALSRTLMDAGDHPVRVWITDSRFRNEILPYVPDSSIFQLDQHPDVDLLAELDDQLDKAAGPMYNIPGGGMLRVEMTSALTSIDVDSASAQSGLVKQTALEINKRAAQEIFRICYLLELGGNIIVDFISMRSKQDREDLQAFVQDMFSYDIRRVNVLRMSRFGLMEINRERVGENLMIRLKWPMYVAGETLLKLWRNRLLKGPVHIEAAPDVADILKARLTHDHALAYLGQPVDIVSNGTRRITDYAVSFS